MPDVHEECVFCQIARGDFETEFLAEDEGVVAFRDLHPQAPSHILVVPRKHFDNVDQLVETDPELATSLISMAVQAARADGIVKSGFRILTNTGPDAGQSVHHVHFHVLGGKQLSEGLA